jgi:hypothetical protein
VLRRISRLVRLGSSSDAAERTLTCVGDSANRQVTMPRVAASLVERFWSKVDRRGPTTAGCGPRARARPSAEVNYGSIREGGAGSRVARESARRCC